MATVQGGAEEVSAGQYPRTDGAADEGVPDDCECVDETCFVNE